MLIINRPASKGIDGYGPRTSRSLKDGAAAPKYGFGYPQLRRRVEETLLLGQRQIEQAKVRTYWETGKIIHEHILKNNQRAEYGTQVIERLAGDLQVSDRLLQQTLKFFRTFPRIPNARSESPDSILTWTHYRTLMSVPDDDKREALAQRALKKEWASRDLQAAVNEIKADPRAALTKGDDQSPAPVLLSEAKQSRTVTAVKPKRGQVGLYQMIQDGEGLALDLGFTSYMALEPRTASRFKANQIVEYKEGAYKSTDAKPADLFTYKASFVKIIDGDTFWMKIWLKDGLWLEEKLRLRGVDTREMTRGGEAAKRQVEALARKASAIVITTTKPDKWDRYLSDVFITVDGQDIFLNNWLIEQGLARRQDRIRLEDWDA